MSDPLVEEAKGLAAQFHAWTCETERDCVDSTKAEAHPCECCRLVSLVERAVARAEKAEAELDALRRELHAGIRERTEPAL